MTDVVPLFEGQAHTSQREPNALCISALERALEKARSGEIIGVGLVELYHDTSSNYALGGRVGSYTMLGAATMMVGRLTEINRAE